MTEMPNPNHPVPATLSEKLTRAIFMILFGVAHYFIFGLITLMAVVQFLFEVFGGKSIPELRALGARLALYNADIIEYMTYKSNAKPWPFASFPTGDDQIRGD